MSTPTGMSSHHTRYPDALPYNAMAASGASETANTTAQPRELTRRQYARTQELRRSHRLASNA